MEHSKRICIQFAKLSLPLRSVTCAKSVVQSVSWSHTMPSSQEMSDYSDSLETVNLKVNRTLLSFIYSFWLQGNISGGYNLCLQRSYALVPLAHIASPPMLYCKALIFTNTGPECIMLRILDKGSEIYLDSTIFIQQMKRQLRHRRTACLVNTLMSGLGLSMRLRCFLFPQSFHSQQQ